jgi:N,N'-diacetyllegionaminate synthase
MSKTIIIAEAGVNHNGDINLAKKLIDVASEARADYVKFQTFDASKLVNKQASKAEYQKTNTKNSLESQYEMLRKLELSKEDHFELIKYCSNKSIKFLSSAFDLDSVDFLNSLDIDYFKIPSGEITNYPYLKKIAETNKKIILSTGMADVIEIKEAINVLNKYSYTKNNIILLHCNSQYPTPMNDVNLKSMETIGKMFNVKFGYSDHTSGIEVPIAAVALGATCIEKHFTIDKSLPGPDHLASLNPIELKNMVSAIRNIEMALGSSNKIVTESEKKNKNLARKSIVAAKKIKKGEILNEENITVKRPGSGLSPMLWNNLIGKIAKMDFEKDDYIQI